MKTPGMLTMVAMVAVIAACAHDGGPPPAADVPPGRNPREPGWHERSIRSGGLERWFRYLVPSNAPAHPATVLLLHGGTQGMKQMFQAKDGGAQAWIGLAEANGFLLVTPNGVNAENGDPRGDHQNWNDLRPEGSKRRSTADDLAFIRSLLDWLHANCATDERRVYVTGASNGGSMTFRLVLELPDRFAAAAAFVATLHSSGDLKPPARPVPLMIVNGTEDPVVKWAGGPVPGGGPKQMSTPDTVAWWVRANHAEQAGGISEGLPDTDPKDKCRIFRTLYPAGKSGAPVLFYRIEGGGHAMPSREHRFREGPILQNVLGIPRDAEGAELAWEFMKPFAAPARGVNRP